jgi:glucose-6-phosphate 1-dehydrogenase
MKQGLIFIAFGVTGDLMQQKILPAIATLRKNGEISDDFKLVGVSRRVSTETGSIFGESFYPLQGDAGDPHTYRQLKDLLISFNKDLEAKGSLIPSQKIVYLSISPAFYKIVFENLGQFADGNTKIMIEKPFGLQGKEAQELNTILHKNFNEKQVYRVDHYLAKESLQELPNSDRRLIENITISFLETAGVEKRGASYDSAGALRDVGQNHMLEMLAMVLNKEHRLAVLEELTPMTTQEVQENTQHTQYKGYTTIPGVASDSPTETSFKIKTRLQNISVTLEGGKYASENKKEITITYKDGRVQHFPVKENRTRSEYEQLILDCIAGNHASFVSEREIELLWRFIDPILKVWYQ